MEEACSRFNTFRMHVFIRGWNGENALLELWQVVVILY